MNEHEALQLALTAITEIDKLADGAAFKGWGAEAAVHEIHGITGNLIGELARAGHTVAS